VSEQSVSKAEPARPVKWNTDVDAGDADAFVVA
jgi:hypothetical protein